MPRSCDQGKRPVRDVKTETLLRRLHMIPSLRRADQDESDENGPVPTDRHMPDSW